MAEVIGLISLQTIMKALRVLAYVVSEDVVNEYLRLGNCTTIESLRRFVKVIDEMFRGEYLRRPTSNNIARLKTIEECSFLGMFGNIDCMH